MILTKIRCYRVEYFVDSILVARKLAVDPYHSLELAYLLFDVPPPTMGSKEANDLRWMLDEIGRATVDPFDYLPFDGHNYVWVTMEYVERRVGPYHASRCGWRRLRRLRAKGALRSRVAHAEKNLWAERPTLEADDFPIFTESDLRHHLHLKMRYIENRKLSHGFEQRLDGLKQNPKADPALLRHLEQKNEERLAWFEALRGALRVSDLDKFFKVQSLFQ